MRTKVRCAAVLLLAAGALVPAVAAASKYDHVVVLVLENENFSTSWGPASPATYLNSLVPSGVFFDHYYATGHASLDNYIAMVSGQPNQPVTASDCLAVNLWECVQPQSLLSNGRNLADQLEEKGLSWKGYMDGMPSPCFHADYDPTAMPPDPYQGNSRKPPAKDYADRHNPFLYFADIIENDTRCKAHVRPYPELARDISNAPGTSLPAFSFITPDTCHDGHDAPCSDGSVGGMKGADDWLKRQVPPLLAYLKAHRGLLIITVDENGFVDGQTDQGCCSGGLGGVLPGHGGRIGLLALSPLLAPRRSSAPYDHMSLLRTIEDAFGIAEHLNNAASSSSMNEMLR